MTTLQQRFEKVWNETAGGTRLSLVQSDKILAFIKQELEMLAEEVEEIIVDAEGLSKFPIGSVDLHTTIGGNAGSRRAAAIIRNRIKSLEV